MGNTAFRDITAGSVGGCVGVISCHPFDTVKTRMQDNQLAKQYKSPTDCFIKTFKYEGIRGLYKGMAYPLGGQVAVNAIVFCVKGYAKKLLSNGNSNMEDSLLVSALAGGAAGIAQSFVCSSMELIKIHMQYQNVWVKTSKHNYVCPVEQSKRIWRAGGVRSISIGLTATVIRDSTGFAAYIASYDQIRYHWAACANRSVKDLSLIQTSIAGGTAGCISWIVNYPIDVVKTRIQSSGLPNQPNYKGIMDCFIKIIKTDGVKGMYRGLAPALVRAFLNSCTLLPAMTYTRNYWPE